MVMTVNGLQSRPHREVKFTIVGIRTCSRDLTTCWLGTRSAVATSSSVGCTGSLTLVLYDHDRGHLRLRL